MAQPNYSERKLKELILYVILKCEQDPWCGSTKLNKILFFADFTSYRVSGSPITGATYQKLEYGPAPRQLLPVRQELEREGAAHLRETKIVGRVQKRLVALRDADLSIFSSAEIAMVDQIIDLLEGDNASEVSALSHSLPGWQLADMNEEIPYETVCLPSEACESEPLSQEELSWAKQAVTAL